MTDGRKKILVVDDDTVFRGLTEEMIISLGYDTLTAEGGLEGKARVQEYNPDAIFTDLSMPDLDGIGMTKQLREMGYRGKVCLFSSQILYGSNGNPDLSFIGDELHKYGIGETEAGNYFDAFLRKSGKLEDVERVLKTFFPQSP